MRTDDISDRDLQGRWFWRGRDHSAVAMPMSSATASDLKLFVLTFAGGFLFMTVFLA